MGKRDECRGCEYWMDNFLGFLPARCSREVITLPLERWCIYGEKKT